MNPGCKMLLVCLVFLTILAAGRCAVTVGSDSAQVILIIEPIGLATTLRASPPVLEINNGANLGRWIPRKQNVYLYVDIPQAMQSTQLYMDTMRLNSNPINPISYAYTSAQTLATGESEVVFAFNQSDVLAIVGHHPADVPITLTVNFGPQLNLISPYEFFLAENANTLTAYGTLSLR